MPGVSVRYIVNNVDEAIDFYTNRLGFTLEMHPAPGFARLQRGDLALLLNQPGAGGAGQSASNGAQPSPGGWLRFQLEFSDLDKVYGELKQAGSCLRSEIIHGNGGRQVLVEDPSGNPVELFEPARR